jgi:2-oxoglutarate ferredoxin oxidoreductase subunit beta
LAQIPGATYIERTSVHSPSYVIKTKKAIKRAFENQIQERGFSMVEILSMCPTYWGMDALQATKHIEDEVTRYFPLGVLLDKG